MDDQVVLLYKNKNAVVVFCKAIVGKTNSTYKINTMIMSVAKILKIVIQRLQK